MSMHPELTTTVYVMIAIVFSIFVIALIVYTRRMNINKVTMAEKGRLPVDKEEGIHPRHPQERGPHRHS